MLEKIRVSIGIPAYNEKQNIDRLLKSLLRQQVKRVIISEIIVISSGSTDKTNALVRKIAATNLRVKLICQKRRLGKASAVNIFLSRAKEDILVLTSADIILKNRTLEYLISPLKRRSVGIVGSHPIPLNDNKTFLGFAAHLQWDLHHAISLSSPKMGECIAFRKIFKQIPILSAVDETNIESLIKGQGYKMVYAPNAIVYNKGPETFEDFITRRRHIYAGHLATKYEYSYEVSTISGFTLLILLLKNFSFSFQFILFTPGVIMLEAYSRLLGFFDYKLKLRSHTIWTITHSTKKLPQLREATA
ncbi:MAG: glycosyltransferase [Candidatus Levybacteria bacterium]|nr:glycosyltransferase [Candidatus Levybacteria bacterium]